MPDIDENLKAGGVQEAIDALDSMLSHEGRKGASRPSCCSACRDLSASSPTHKVGKVLSPTASTQLLRPQAHQQDTAILFQQGHL